MSKEAMKRIHLTARELRALTNVLQAAVNPKGRENLRKFDKLIDKLTDAQGEYATRLESLTSELQAKAKEVRRMKNEVAREKAMAALGREENIRVDDLVELLGGAKIDVYLFPHQYDALKGYWDDVEEFGGQAETRRIMVTIDDAILEAETVKQDRTGKPLLDAQGGADGEPTDDAPDTPLALPEPARLPRRAGPR